MWQIHYFIKPNRVPCIQSGLRGAYKEGKLIKLPMASMHRVVYSKRH